MPTSPDYLSEPLRKLVGDGSSGITWNSSTQTYSYRYPRAYPVSIPLIRVFTLGLLSGRSPQVIESFFPGTQTLGQTKGGQGADGNPH